MSDDRLRAVVATGVLASEEQHRVLLQSIVEVARAIFAAKASSIFLLDEDADELVFEAVAGEGSDTLIGTRIPSSTGIAGWVLVTRQPLVLDDVQNDPRWGGRDISKKTGYVPNGLMAVPLLNEDRSLGVLQVLDRQSQRFSLEEMELLGLFASQAAIALDLLGHARRAQRVLADSPVDVGVVARLAAAVEALEDERREAGLRLLGELETVLKP
jgi:GAF domain-containing protein